MGESRTLNTINNVKSGFIMQIINKLMAFVIRTIFIISLNEEYLGVNGLFSNILSILSFAELGIGSAIIFNMYKPIANDDREKIKSLMDLYKKIYIIIGCVIFILGCLLIPFLPYLVKDVPQIKENIIYIYFLFLINSTVSYFFTFKKSIIIANQKENIINKIDCIYYILLYLIQMILLLIYKNYIFYLYIMIIGTFIENLIISIVADKMYPYLKEKNIKKIDINDMKNIIKDVRALVVYKVGSIIMYGSDNIIISSMINVVTVGICSNYSLIINSVKTVINSALNGITASIGNLNAIDEKEKQEDVFYQITFINFWLYSFCAIAFIVLLNPFIEIWLGEKFLLGIEVSIALAISFLVEGLRLPAYTYRTTMGLFEKGKITPYIAVITNIIFSIVLGKICGVVGIFLGTSLAQLLSYSWIDPYLIHKYGFETPIKKYVNKYFLYIIIFSFASIITYFGSQVYIANKYVSFIIKCIIVCIIPNIIIFLCTLKFREFEELKERIINLFKGKVRDHAKK